MSPSKPSPRRGRSRDVSARSSRIDDDKKSNQTATMDPVPSTSGGARSQGVKRKTDGSPAVHQSKKPNSSIPVADNDDKLVRPYKRSQAGRGIVCKPPGGVPEYTMLFNEVLSNIYTDNLDKVQHNLTDFSIYGEDGHMCTLDSGLIESNIPLYSCGYVKPIYDRSPSTEGGIATVELGPLLEWWITVFDDENKVIVGISTVNADYYLIEPHPNYKDCMKSVTEKIHLNRLVMKYILSKIDETSFEDLLNYVLSSVNPATSIKFTEDIFFSHAQFVIDQVADYSFTDFNHVSLIDFSCIKLLAAYSGSQIPRALSNKHKKLKTKATKDVISKPEFSKATTTELVKAIFERIFADQLNIDEKDDNFISKIVNTVFDCAFNTEVKEKSSKSINDEDQVFEENKNLKKGMFVAVKRDSSKLPLIGRIEYGRKKNFKQTKLHITLFMYRFETILGDVIDSRELFALQKCMDINISDVIEVVNVTHKAPSIDWFSLGGSKLEDFVEPVDLNDKKSFFYQFFYDEELARFEYKKQVDPKKVKGKKYCFSCEAIENERKSQLPELFETDVKEGKKSKVLRLRNEFYKNGSFIYLQPNIFSTVSRSNFIGKTPFKHIQSEKIKTKPVMETVDENKYPEYYRKTAENSSRGSNDKTPNPFEIAEILRIYPVGLGHDVNLIVRRMYRAEQIPLNDNDKYADMNMLYWSEEEFKISYKDIIGKCYVAYSTNVIDPLDWCQKGPDRFYFTNEYDFQSGTIVPEYKLSCAAKLTGNEVRVNSNDAPIDVNKMQNIPSYKDIKPLRALDIFAGCGGLSKGLEESGLIESKWAVEYDEKAAAAYKLNNPEATVFNDDCNRLLKLVLSGSKVNDKGQKLPQKGEVDLICGGPPCQGFSGMNRFHSGQHSVFKNSLIVSFLSYIDFYRPKYVVMENVKNFILVKEHMVLSLTLACLIRLGYQCTFGLMQAGDFGVPQTRRRLIIYAAAPGEQLPLYPEPLHVFNRKGSGLNVQIKNKKYKTNCKYEDSAPMRTVTVFDAWSDLPFILNGASEHRLLYKFKPATHLQKLLRYPYHMNSDSILTDHICKDMSSLVQARMELIPVKEGSDWRDLPNIHVKLRDGTSTNKLVYAHNDDKNGKSKCGALRGVCPCACGGKCHASHRQSNTIIPWCLPHTANRHNNWAGLYGRLAWSGYCSTTITNPEPMGKQGRVLHPDQHRVVSVRECARSQGFNDSFKFFGLPIDKHRQIGNAVPPPMGKAIGREIVKAIHKNSISA